MSQPNSTGDSSAKPPESPPTAMCGKCGAVYPIITIGVMGLKNYQVPGGKCDCPPESEKPLTSP